jgi:hypothetical protein
MSDYPCPKCGKSLTRGSKAASGKQRWECKKYDKGDRTATYCYSTTNPEGALTDRNGNKAAVPTVFKRTLQRTERFLITSAQNATPVHAEFWKSLQQAAKALKAEIIVIPLRYKNVTSQFTASQKNEEYWVKEVQPYLYNARLKLNPNLMVMGDIKTQPTASSPLTGFDGITGASSGIFGHTKLQLRTVATPQGKLPKILTTTGACTVPNYTDSRAGKLGEFHHTLGAVMVEVRGKEFHLRQINADKNGEFIDLDKWYSPRGVKKAPPALALSMGDTHVRVCDPQVTAATFGKGGIVETLNPEVLAWHDLLDGDSINHHHNGNPFLSAHKREFGLDDARKEVMEAIAFLDKHSQGRMSIVVPSNHDDFLQRWLASADWRQDPTNAEFYLESALAMVRQAKSRDVNAEKLNAFTYWISKELQHRKNIRCLKNDESYTVAGIALDMHGDRGPNGARGSLKNLRRIGVKTIIGHSHSPGIDEGGYQNGTSTKLRLGYNTGPSSWLNSHTVVYANGKRCLINIIGGKWRLK